MSFGSHALRGAVVALALFGGFALAARPAEASAGLQVLLQAWNPTQPDTSSQPVSTYADPTLFSDTVGQAWSRSRDAVCKALQAELGKGDLIAHGVTLYNMTCSMGQLASLAIAQQHDGSNAVSLALTVPGNAFAATSTQPTVAGSYADPRFSVSYDVELDADLTLYPLSISNATIHVKNVHVDSQNAVADIAKALDDFFLNGHYQRLAEQELTLNQALPVDSINGALASVQTPLQTYVNRYVQIGFWVRNGVLIVDFAPRPIANPGGGSVSGAFTWSKSGNVKLASCSGFSLQASFQNGPQPLLSPPGNLGAAPTMNVGTPSIGALVDRGDHFECPYTIGGLPIAFPTTLAASVQGATLPPGGDGHFQWVVAVVPSGWNDPLAPLASTPGKNFVVASTLAQTRPFQTVQQLGGFKNPGDPAARGARVVLPGDQTTNIVKAGADHVALYNAGLSSLKLGSRAQGIAQLQAAYTLARSAGDLKTLNLAANALRGVGASIPGAASAPATVVVP